MGIKIEVIDNLNNRYNLVQLGFNAKGNLVEMIIQDLDKKKEPKYAEDLGKYTIKFVQK